MADAQYDVVIVGSGPGGYVCAIRAAQLGLKTAVVEKDKTFGGTCLNVGCIPSKALLESSEYLSFAVHEFENHGINVSSVKVSLEKMMARKDKIVKDLTGGIAFLFKKNKIDPYKGVGRISKAGFVEVKGEDGKVTSLEAKSIVIATGSVPTELPFLKFDEQRIVSSTGALSLPKVPKHLLVVGGGVIGLELGSVWMRLGAEVTVLEYADKICPFMDQATVAVLRKSLEKQGMKFITKAKVSGCNTGKDVELTYEDMNDNSQKKISGDIVLVSTGRKPYTTGLGVEDVGIQMDKVGRILVDAHLRTNIPGIYAIGDCVPGPMLAHKAEEEGVAIAEQIAGQAGHVNYATVPSVIYTYPEVASVGLSEEQCKEKGIAYNVGSFPFSPNARAKALGLTDGMCRIIADAKSDKIIGGHIVGPRASELLGEIVVAMEFGGSSEDLARSFHAHPTLNEVVREAALGVSKRIRQM